jgi:hypothetical protein
MLSRVLQPKKSPFGISLRFAGRVIFSRLVQSAKVYPTRLTSGFSNVTDERYLQLLKASEPIVISVLGNTKPSRYVCEKCGQEYPIDSGINVINDKTINTFPNPSIDLDVDYSFTKKIKFKK